MAQHFFVEDPLLQHLRRPCREPLLTRGTVPNRERLFESFQPPSLPSGMVMFAVGKLEILPISSIFPRRLDSARRGRRDGKLSGLLRAAPLRLPRLEPFLAFVREIITEPETRNIVSNTTPHTK